MPKSSCSSPGNGSDSELSVLVAGEGTRTSSLGPVMTPFGEIEALDNNLDPVEALETVQCTITGIASGCGV